jgi:hypothetical protein
MKQFTIQIPFENDEGKNDTFSFPLYVGKHPEILCHNPVAWQSAWLQQVRGHNIPDDVLGSFSRLLNISRVNHCDLEELCAYTFGDQYNAKPKPNSLKKTKGDQKKDPNKDKESIWQTHLSWLENHDSVNKEFKLVELSTKRKRLRIAKNITISYKECDEFADALALAIIPKVTPLSNYARKLLKHVIIVKMVMLRTSERSLGYKLSELLFDSQTDYDFHETFTYKNAVALDTIAAELPIETFAVIQTHTELWQAGNIINDIMRKAVVDWLKKPYKGARNEIGALWKEMNACPV